MPEIVNSLADEYTQPRDTPHNTSDDISDDISDDFSDDSLDYTSDDTSRGHPALSFALSIMDQSSLATACISHEEWEDRRERIRELLLESNPHAYITQIHARILEPGIFTPNYNQLRYQIRTWIYEGVMVLPWPTKGNRRNRIRRRPAAQIDTAGVQNDTAAAQSGTTAAQNETLAVQNETPAAQNDTAGVQNDTAAAQSGTGASQVLAAGQLQEFVLQAIWQQVKNSKKRPGWGRLQRGGELRASKAHELQAQKAELQAQKLAAAEARQLSQATNQARKQLRRAGIEARKQGRLRKSVAQLTQSGFPIPPELQDPITDPEADSGSEYESASE
ncbi:hypothetical protein V493_00728, partial [Pseudogymnoascus sp. VKM F-4281 (FW-2241)]